MTTAVKPLLVLCLLSVLLGTGALLAASEEQSAGAMAQEVLAFAESTVAQGAWRWFFRLTAGVTLLALGAVAVEILWKPARVRREQSFEALQGANLREALEEVKARVHQCASGRRPDIIRLFDEVTRGALKLSASDIHLTPGAQQFRMTYRVQGSLHEIARLPPELGPMLVTRVKVLARLNTFVRSQPQDGRLVNLLDGGTIEARISTLPTEWGERVVLRLVRGGRAVPDLAALGFPETLETKLRELLLRPQGLLFVTGPVGSGKTTTLYAALKHIAESRGGTTSLVSLEDPIEMELSFVTQSQINSQVGLTFPKVLRSVLRQDPNVLMVGEIRDHETAEIAAQAGLTGHLLLTTVHASSAAGVFPRVLDMGVEPFALSSASLGSLSQRLVRTLCIACRTAKTPDGETLERLATHGIALPDATYYEPVGCEYCENSGFTGRAPITELVIVDGELERAIQERRSSRELHELAVTRGTVPLLQDGLQRAVSGETSLDELLKAAG